MSSIKLFAALLILSLWGAVAHAGKVTYVYSDPQGTPLAEADASGNITARFDYTPYGESVPSMGAAPNGVGYTGHVNDPETGLVYMQARYYDPEVGRLLSVDPVAPSVGSSFSFNRYAYANNNPSMNIDPYGRQACEGSKSGCIKSGNYIQEKTDGKTVVQSSSVDDSSKENMPLIQTDRTTERGMRFDQDAKGAVGATEVPVKTTVIKTSKGPVFSSVLQGVSGSTSIGHSHPNANATIVPGPHDDNALNQGTPNNIVNNGNVIVVEKVNGQYRVRILSNVSVRGDSRSAIKKVLDSYQQRSQE